MQAASPWEQCVAEMWAKDRGPANNSATSSSVAPPAAAPTAAGKDTILFNAVILEGGRVYAVKI